MLVEHFLLLEFGFVLFDDFLLFGHILLIDFLLDRGIGLFLLLLLILPSPRLHRPLNGQDFIEVE